MLHAWVTQKVLNCNVFKALFRSARLGRVEAVAAARSAETTTTSKRPGEAMVESDLVRAMKAHHRSRVKLRRFAPYA